jgi:preprotein translocase subunit SecA
MHFLTDDYRLTVIRKAGDIPTGLNALVYKCAGRLKRMPWKAAGLVRQAQRLFDTAARWKDVPDDTLRAALAGYKELATRQGPGSDGTFSEAIGAITEAAYRTLGMRPYMVQVAGALALYKGYIAEMATGEGKTLTAALTAIVYAWSGRPCHIITANDYLAGRDAEKLSPLYSYCGLTVGSVLSTMKPPDRRAGYARAITYSTAKEVTADFLRDRLALGAAQAFERRQIRELFGNETGAVSDVVTRGLYFAIIDEADSLLIDEAVTPLIIARSRENEPFVKACRAASCVAAQLKPGVHYTVDSLYKDVHLLPSLTIRNSLMVAGIPRQFSGDGFQRELIRQALTAKEFFHRDKQYVVQDDKVVIVDDFTGRTMEQRSWSAGLHQLVEAKESLPITPPTETLARLSFQRYFRFYHRLSGMTGTARESATELWHVYGLPFVRIRRNRPSRFSRGRRRFFLTQEEKAAAITGEIRRLHREGRPVLVGTRSVRGSEDLAGRLTSQGLSCRIINAVRSHDEADIVGQAGAKGAITIATNMAGRGTDILIDRDVEGLGGLHVIAAECNESGRIDRQLFGRCARQGDRGSAQSFMSMDDELFVRFLGPLSRAAVAGLVRAGNPLTNALADLAVRVAQGNAQRKAYVSRRSVQKTDTWLQDSLSFAQEEF